MKQKCNRHSRFPLFITLLTLIFLYTPLILVGVASFNASKYGGAWTRFSLIWYERLFRDRSIWEALVNTLIIALIATFFSTLLGTLSALALYRSKSKLKGIYQALVYTPLVVPDILLGISMLLFFVTFLSVCGTLFQAIFGIELKLGMTTIVIAHITFCMSYVTMVVLGRLQEFDKSLIEAAQDLGASGLYTFFKVTLPIISPGVIAGALFAFTLSIDDFVITFFVKGAGDTTLPIYIQSAMRRGTPAVINALSVIFLLLTFVLVFITQKLMSNKTEIQK
ncbi:MAG: ABC transporter permease [Lentisphaeria bacterium]|nr:ABC transporter permease [Lentisphaeria bacterium]